MSRDRRPRRLAIVATYRDSELDPHHPLHRRRGYLRRRPDPADGRARLIEFSDRGRAAVRTAEAVFRDMEAELGSRLGTAEVRQLRHALEAIAAG